MKVLIKSFLATRVLRNHKGKGNLNKVPELKRFLVHNNTAGNKIKIKVL